MHLSEVWAEGHWNDAHIQESLWGDFHADFALLNGRVYPDTTLPSTIVDPWSNPPYAPGYVPYDTDFDLPIPTTRPDLRYQPLSSLVTCNAGERVLLRFSNLGFTQAAMTLSNIRMRIVGKDAAQLKGRTGADGSYWTDSIPLGAGESVEALFDAPAHSGGSGPDTYLLYNREYRRSNNLAAGGYGGQVTEVHVYPSATLRPQNHPHEAVVSA